MTLARDLLTQIRMRRTTSLIPFALTISVAHAQPAFEKTGTSEDVKDVTERTWTAKGDAGLVASTGNSRTTTITGSANAVRKDVDNKFEVTLVGAYARASTRTAVDANGDNAIAANELGSTTVTSAQNGAIKLRYDRYLSKLDALYIAALAGFDMPAGKDFQGGAQLGYSRGLYKDDDQEVLGEIGYDLSYIKLSAGSSATVHSARLFSGYKGNIKKETALEASVEALINGNTVTYGMREAGLGGATRLIGIVGVTSTLSTRFSLNASFTAKYDQFPAPLAPIGGIPFIAGFEPAAEKLDTLTKISLIVKIL